MRAKERATSDRSWVPSKYNQIHSCQLKTSLLGSFCASLNMRDVYFVHVINNCQAISASVARGKRQDGANPSSASQLCCEEEASDDVSPAYSFAASQDSPMRSTMKARMTMFKLSTILLW